MNILITIDSDESFHYILKEAHPFIQAFPHAEIHLFTVWDVASATSAGHTAIDAVIMDTFHRQSNELITAAKTIFGDRHFTFTSEVGEPADEIENKLMKMPCDLLIMGTHGRTGINHLLMGSVAEKMLRLSKCNTLVIPIRKKA